MQPLYDCHVFVKPAPTEGGTKHEFTNSELRAKELGSVATIARRRGVFDSLHGSNKYEGVIDKNIICKHNGNSYRITGRFINGIWDDDFSIMFKYPEFNG